MTPPTLTDALSDEAKRETDLRDALNRALRENEKLKDNRAELAAAIRLGARDASLADPIATVPRPTRDQRRGKAEVALWHLTDWQGSKITPTYNSEVMRQRVHHFCDVAERITVIQRAEHPVRQCHVLFGGDMVEGLFQFPTQPFEVDATLFRQWRRVSKVIVEVVRRALAIYDEVSVTAEWGNHGRIGSKRDAVPKEDNFDRMCYETARDILGEQKRLHWDEPSAEDIQRVEIGNYRALLMHGDETGRNGYVSDTTFINYLNRLKAGAYPWSFRDVYTGHFHTHIEYPLADDGTWYRTGSTESDNRYAMVGLGSRAKPSQRLHFVDPIRGRVTAQYKVWLPIEALEAAA